MTSQEVENPTEDATPAPAPVERPAGFWIRFTAGLIDLTGVVAVVSLAAKLAAGFGKYIPIEVTVIAAYAVYTAAAVAWKGHTLGGWICGEMVTCRDGRRPSLVRATVRALFVAVSQCLLGLPFLTIVARRSKRGWYDALSGTQVRLLPDCRTRRRRAVMLTWSVLGAWILVQAADAWSTVRFHRAWRLDANATAERRPAHTDPAVDVSTLNDAQRHEMAAWLAEHAQEPDDCVVRVAAQHQVTIIGEVHGKKQYLAFLNRIIPRLYHEAGVRTIALECCLSNQDDELARLVGGTGFDRELAMNIAREGVWEAWGWKGYWDVLETVWKLNRSLTPEQEPLRIVGIFPRFDMPSFALVKEGPLLEKLRIVRLFRIDAFARVACHDACYARCVEQSAFTEGSRTVVWVGAAHALLRCSQQIERHGRVVARAHRMGSMLYGRYGGQVGQIILHSDFAHGKVARLAEECAAGRLEAGLAFTVAESPFAALRDGSEPFYYGKQPDLRFGDLVSVYLMLAPNDKLEPCGWLDGFISRRMFGRNRPFYEIVCNQKLSDYHEADRCMSECIGNL